MNKSTIKQMLKEIESKEAFALASNEPSDEDICRVHKQLFPNKYKESFEDVQGAVQSGDSKFAFNGSGHLIFKDFDDIKEYIKTLPKTINVGAFNKHVYGEYNYNEHRKSMSQKGIKYGPSVVYLSINTAQELIDRYSGTGDFGIDGDVFKNTEEINTKQVIGRFINLTTNESFDTTSFRIHYSKKGTHIIPSIRGRVK